MKGKGKAYGKGRAGARAPLALAAALLAAALVFTVSYAYARYATEYEAAAPVALFDVTSEITYVVDEWGEAKAFGGDLGTMMPKESEGVRTIDFTITVYNRSDVPIYCTLTLGGDYGFTFGESESYTLSDDSKTLTTGVLAAGATGSMDFTVIVGTYTGDASGVDVYSGTLDITVTYIQASEEETP